MTAAQAAAAFGYCGQLTITKGATGGNPLTRRSIDAVMVTIGGKAPTYVTPASPTSTAFMSPQQTYANPLQNAIDNAR